ncbi:hypothetical protein GCM10023219_01320 [Stakelama sediminis]|uniref:Murein DD-endopeptidase MepM/ murein hydrolase activator NlpD n=1 Tax=Stakelama sediminis TaxID=463200 RepID=A0A840Z157_9SPHN|nr:M23 family metallopeptidase [Stakelama sediminis]MBB5719432.1 murein DD-endopeptidase MepM/ murein hydrolase activator NlpD [Stakelama sediminis]
MLMTGVAGITLCFSAYGAATATAGVIAASGLVGDQSPEAQLARMHSRVKTMQADVAAVRKAAAAHAVQVEQRQAMIAAVLSGRGNPEQLAKISEERPLALANSDARSVVAPFHAVESRQVNFAIKARQQAEARYSKTAANLKKLGLSPNRLVPAMGGPYEPVSIKEEKAQAAAGVQFRKLFQAWKKLDSLEQAVISIPSSEPVKHVTFSSNFGVRTDPFTGTKALHPGVDIPGAVGTPVYATADGMVDRAGRAGGYGNMVEINHGRGIETRYGHLSKVLVKDHTRVHRGELIGLMGSTGRSTGPHLHYEVRIDGHAVNPKPYLEDTSYLAAVQARAEKNRQLAMGGPGKGDTAAD